MMIYRVTCDPNKVLISSCTWSCTQLDTVGIHPVCIISCVNNWHVSLVIRKWFSNSPDKYAGVVTSKYPFTPVNSLRIKQATAARSITSSLLSRMVQIIVSQSSCSKAAKMFKKSAILKHNKFSPSIPCVAEHVTSNSGKQLDAFHSTSKNSENLNRWLLLNGKRPWYTNPGARFNFILL